MNQTILNDNTTVYYVVKVNGEEVSRRCATQQEAAATIPSLAESMQNNAQIVPVDANGRQVLLG